MSKSVRFALGQIYNWAEATGARQLQWFMKLIIRLRP